MFLRNLANSRSFLLVITSPLKNISPLVTLSIVAIQFNRVVFPDPEVPIIPKNSPSRTLKDTPLNAFVSLSPSPYIFSTFFIFNNILSTFYFLLLQHFIPNANIQYSIISYSHISQSISQNKHGLSFVPG